MELDISGNAAVVSASSSGLGKASAIATGRVVGHADDITRREDIVSLVEHAADEFGRLDHVVTSAGGPARMRPLDASDEDWYAALDLLLMSVVRLVREAEPLLRADGGGTVVNITSRVVKKAALTNVLSSSVRMAVVGFEKTLSKELGPEIRSDVVLPGAHETSRLERGFERKAERGDFETAADAAETQRQEIPVKQFGDPAEFGNLVAFLSSPRASFVNGLAIVVDGGSGKSTL